MKYEWKQTIFTPEDLAGSGQYLVREPKDLKLETPFVSDSGYLQTIMQKVGYTNDKRNSLNGESQMCLICVSDGLIFNGYYKSVDENGVKIDVDKWEWVSFSGESNLKAKQALCDYLNNNIHGDTYRFATKEELIRVAVSHNWRAK